MWLWPGTRRWEALRSLAAENFCLKCSQRKGLLLICTALWAGKGNRVSVHKSLHCSCKGRIMIQQLYQPWSRSIVIALRTEGLFWVIKYFCHSSTSIPGQWRHCARSTDSHSHWWFAQLLIMWSLQIGPFNPSYEKIFRHFRNVKYKGEWLNQIESGWEYEMSPWEGLKWLKKQARDPRQTFHKLWNPSTCSALLGRAGG